MDEEHEFQAAEGGHRLCVNNCGFFGSPTTHNMCSKCYREISLEKSGDAANPIFSALSAPASASTVEPTMRFFSSPAKAEPLFAAVVPPSRPDSGRCSTCHKKVGLTGFHCRCSATFCGTHRYPEEHECTFDFKAMGREAIAKANPLVKAGKDMIAIAVAAVGLPGYFDDRWKPSIPCV